MKKEEYEGQIEKLKKNKEQYRLLLEVLENRGEIPYQCCECDSWMDVIDAEEYHHYDHFSVKTNTWHSQFCDCCPMCAKDGFPWLDEPGIGSKILVQKNILEMGGQPCTDCMDWYTTTIEQKIENAIIKFSGMEGYTDDVYHALQYVSGEDLYSDSRYPNPWGPTEETPKSWCDKQEWFEIAFA